MAKILKQMQKLCYAPALLICMDQTPSLNRLQLQEGKSVEREHTEGRVVEDYSIRDSKISFKW